MQAHTGRDPYPRVHGLENFTCLAHHTTTGDRAELSDSEALFAPLGPIEPGADASPFSGKSTASMNSRSFRERLQRPRLRQVLHQVDDFGALLLPDGAAIVFCATRKNAAFFADILTKQGINCGCFHGGLESEKKKSMTKSYADLARAIRQYCHTSVIRDNNRELFARMVYNILVTNDDDHLRNHGFVWDAHIGGWRLSPLYDVMPKPSVAFERQLHLGVGAQGRTATLDNAMTHKEAFNVSEREACEIISRIWRCVRQWRMYFEQYGVAAKDIDAISTAFRRIEDVATPELIKRLP